MLQALIPYKTWLQCSYSLKQLWHVTVGKTRIACTFCILFTYLQVHSSVVAYIHKHCRKVEQLSIFQYRQFTRKLSNETGNDCKRPNFWMFVYVIYVVCFLMCDWLGAKSIGPISMLPRAGQVNSEPLESWWKKWCMNIQCIWYFIQRKT